MDDMCRLGWNEGESLEVEEEVVCVVGDFSLGVLFFAT